MKKITALLISLLALSSCYEEYVLDYEYDAIYIPFQYDLRSFVIGENNTFKIGTALGGVIENKEDRDVFFSLDASLLTRDLSYFGGDEPFTAIDGLKGDGKCGKVAQDYVITETVTKKVQSLKPLPENYYTISNDSKMVIEKGMNTAQVVITADESLLLADANFGIKPYYAIAFRIVDAQADTVLKDRSFEIIALKAENMLFGDWYHGGKSSIVHDGSGMVLSTDVYPTRIPCDENTSSKYILTTATPTTLTTNYFHNQNGSMTIHMDGHKVGISDDKGRITDMGCSWNEAKLLQDRQVYLNYKYPNGNGTSTVVTDTLTFRARLRDGVNEWQDTVKEHYN